MSQVAFTEGSRGDPRQVFLEEFLFVFSGAYSCISVYVANWFI